MGGYQLVDFKDINLTTSKVKIDGIYETIESNNRKPLLLHNVVVNNLEIADCYAYCVAIDQKYQLYYGNPDNYIIVDKNNMVSLF